MIVIIGEWTTSRKGIIRPHRSTAYIDAAYCYWQSSVICRSAVRILIPAKMAEPIEVPFGLLTHMGQGTMMRWGPNHP